MSKSALVSGVTYHGSTAQSLSGLDNVYGKHISAARLRDHLKWYQQRFQVVGLGELMRGVRQGKPPPRHSLFIVFHDGYLGNYLTAFPILKELGVVATFFITTDFMGSGKRFWVDVLDAAVKNSPGKEIETGRGGETLPLGDVRSRSETAIRLRQSLKPLPEETFAERFSETLEALGFSSADEVPRLGDHEACMDWSMVREMADGGMEFGSHSHRHVICARQDAEIVRQEMEASKTLIEKETGGECELFCYPNGSFPSDGNEKTDRMARETGYRHVLYMLGPYNLIDSRTFRLTAIAFGDDSDREELKRSLSRWRYRRRRLLSSAIWPWDTNRLE